MALPHRKEAEAAVLGGILLRGSDALADALELLTEEDFYIPAYQATFLAMRSLAEKGVTIDIVTLCEQLRRSGSLELVGGIEGLAKLDKYATAHNIKDHASIVREASRLRELATASRDIAEAAMHPDADFTDLAASAEKTLRAASEVDGSAGPKSARELMLGVFEGITERQRQEDAVTGISTGYEELDEMTAGLQPTDLIIVAARPSMGKAQPLDAKVLTPKGYVLMGELAVGDAVASTDGSQSVITGVYPQGVRDVFRVTLSDGRSSECCAEHLWRVSYRGWSEPRVLRTDAIQAMLGQKTYRNRIWIELAPGRTRQRRLTISTIEYSRVCETQCISVSHPSRLYVTDDYIVTHNTAFALNLAQNACVMPARYKNNPEAAPPRFPVLFFSLEMGREQLIERMLCAEARVDYQALRRGGRMLTQDFRELIDAADRVAKSELWIDDTASLSITTMAARAKRWSENPKVFPQVPAGEEPKHPRGLVMVDYLQLARGGKKAYASRETEISDISQGLKAMAKNLKMPVIALSQLNRAVDSRADHRPQLSDLRESGAIEQDADVIMFIYREERYLPPTATEEQREKAEGTAEVIVGKQRNGPIGTVNMTFIKKHTRFESRAREFDGP